MTTLRKIANAALDLLFPPKCAGCGREGAYLCDTCQPTLTRLERPYCDLCAGPSSEGICSWCEATPPAYDGIRAPYRHTGTVRDMVHDLKYRKRPHETLGRILDAELVSPRRVTASGSGSRQHRMGEGPAR